MQFTVPGKSKRPGEQQVTARNAELNLVNPPAVVNYINQAEATLSAAATDNAYEIRFREINSDTLNEFAIAIAAERPGW